MKRNIPRLFPVLLALLLLAGCGGATESARTAMRLEPVALSENETELLALANADPAKFALYAYRADENLRAISVRRYVLNDALEWEQDAAYTNAVFDETLSPTGRIGLMETDGGSYSYNLRTGGVGYAVPAPALPDGLPGNASEGMGRLDGGGEIVYGQEIPLLLHTLRTDGSMPVLAAAEWRNADFLERFADSAFTEIYTVTFSGQVPA